MRKTYTEFRNAIASYVRDDAGQSTETLIDGVLEYLVVTERLDPNEFDGWPEDGLVAPLMADRIGA